MNSYSVGKINIQANHDNPALVIVADAPSMQGFNAGLCMTPKQMARLFEMLGSAIDDGVAIISPCDPIPEAIAENNRLVMEHLTASAADFMEALTYYQPRAIVTLGKIGLSQVAGRSAKIMSERGSFHTYERTGAVPVMPVNSIANLFIRPQIAPIMESDLRQVTAMAENGWEPVVSDNVAADYSWCLDLEELLANPPKRLVVDTETLGLKWFQSQAILTVQLCSEEGKAIAIPLNKDYWNDDSLRGESSKHLPKLTDAKVRKLVNQLRQLLGNPEVQVCGHHLKYDCHHLRQYGIEVANWKHDTLQLVFTVDENMRQKNLDEATRRWVPAMAGYADVFNNDPIHEKKTRMDKVRHDDMLQYGCGDVDACMRLATVLVKEAKKDERNYAVYEKVKMPAIKHVFLNHAERYGLPLVQSELVTLENNLAEKASRLETELLREAAEQWPAVLRRHMDKGCKFSRPDFVRDILFSPDGLNLTPVLATKKTRKLAEEDQLESTSKKDHLPYFEHIPWVAKLMEHQTVATLIKSFTGRQSKAEWAIVKPLKNGGYGKKVVEAFARAGRELPTARPGPVRRRLVQTGETPPHEPDPRTEFTIGETTYAVGGSQVFVLVEEEAKGFWHYLETIDPNALHPNFGLSTAVTGRTNCNSPNLQNIPKRGEEAKAFRKIFKAPPGWVFIECDESQAELRVAAAMAKEKNMIKVYKAGGDIHAMTGQRVAGLTDAQWAATPDERREELRQMAKAVNFGYLFGMWWKKFKQYAKTSYGVTVTDREAERSRETYFQLYPGLERYHQDMRAFANKHKYVRALHGALRRLPDIDSVEEGMRKEAERQAINSPVQGFASDLGLMGATLFADGVDTNIARVLGFIHDATVVMAKVEHAPQVASWLRWCMENQPLEQYFGLTLPIPIVADVTMGPNLAEMKKQPQVVPVRPPWVTV